MVRELKGSAFPLSYSNKLQKYVLAKYKNYFNMVLSISNTY